ncbi:MAG: patatin-like phospholipase family protein [Verrucomicrobiota bacterium]
MSNPSSSHDAHSGSCYEAGFPRPLREAEAEAVAARRLASGRSPEGEALEEMVGLAFSGGGIRSATFCLGVLQALARKKFLRRIDYLSTVSGGGYIGGFLGALFTRPWVTNAGASRPVDTVEKTLSDPYSPPLNWLRENGRYISPNGAGDTLVAVATYLRSWIGLHFLLSVFVMMIFAGPNLLRQLAWHRFESWQKWEQLLAVHAGESIWWSPFLFIPALLLGIFVLPLIWGFWLTQRDTRDLGSRTPAIVTLLVLIVALFVTIRAVWEAMPARQFVAGTIALLALLSLGFWRLAIFRSLSKDPGVRLRLTRNHLSSWLATALGATGLSTLLVVIDSLGQTSYALFQLAEPHPLSALAAATGFLALMGLVQRIATYLAPQPSRKARRIRLPVALISTAAALGISFALLTLWSAVIHSAAWWGETPAQNPGARIYARLRPSQPEVTLDAQRRLLVTEPAASPLIGEGSGKPPLRPIALTLGVTFLLSALLGRSLKFLNLSSQQSIYNARLSRAYLGASNEARWSGPGQRITEVIEGDEISGSGDPHIAMPYRPDRNGGPLHLINVTLNETVDGKSQVEQRDRKGLPLAIGPCGMSVGLRSHAFWHADGGDDLRYTKIRALNNEPGAFHQLSGNGDQPRCVERLDLGTWVAVSGAAFSTGLGSKTSFGLALLAGLANVRLGYWWDSLIDPKKRASRVQPRWGKRLFERITEAFPAQMHLLDEFFARFHGASSRRWYLSDGGHFENTAAYELLRRRLPFIIICDCGQDADYTFDDTANLVRKARIDFNAEIRFLAAEELKDLLPGTLQACIGTLQQLHRLKHSDALSQADREGRFPGEAYSTTHAALAWIYYDGASRPASMLLLIKPSLTGDESLDLLEYHSSQPAFPQEPTVDQFFDEAQWESYRRLGDHIASELFAEVDGKWGPAMMKRPG